MVQPLYQTITETADLEKNAAERSARQDEAKRLTKSEARFLLPPDWSLGGRWPDL